MRPPRRSRERPTLPCATGGAAKSLRVKGEFRFLAPAPVAAGLSNLFPSKDILAKDLPGPRVPIRRVFARLIRLLEDRLCAEIFLCGSCWCVVPSWLPAVAAR